MCMHVLLSLWLCGVPQAPGVDRGELERCIDVFLGGDAAKGAGALQILYRHPQPARDAIDDRIEDMDDPGVKQRLTALRQRVLQVGLARTIFQRVQTGLTFSGQWTDLAQYDPEVGGLLMDLARNPQIDEGPMQAVRESAFQAIREGALHAIADLKLTALLPDLKALTEDVLNEDWLIEGAGMAMAELGDRSWIDRRLEALGKTLAEAATDVPRRYAVQKLLSRYYYRLNEYARALEAYEATAAILEARAATLTGRDARVLKRMLWLTCYNAACSASKAGSMDAVFQYLDRTLKADSSAAAVQELAANIREDGDLKEARKDPRYRDFAGRLRRLLAGQGDKL
ncbi:MAG TPA: hypothetical protein PKX48_06515 [Planctomycetota bacterium]|nr:hypothetical protein [Planctomycetota bacterium]OQC21313.1 MAG: hypothetical protein BWX69_01044 [Planctomycetes bacterium ADurb.Bin069]NMD36088.1 hypothetical protein [Planctomycetota bacterium]HNR99644.1 hypothetical protein [Planctomycetota bacterium]HNU25228.1 hypothetical protein [Planctomycetota bacterium]